MIWSCTCITSAHGKIMESTVFSCPESGQRLLRLKNQDVPYLRLTTHIFCTPSALKYTRAHSDFQFYEYLNSWEDPIGAQFSSASILVIRYFLFVNYVNVSWHTVLIIWCLDQDKARDRPTFTVMTHDMGWDMKTKWGGYCLTPKKYRYRYLYSSVIET
jgi:hypothetical protein